MVTVSAAALGPACNPAVDCSGRANTVGLQGLLGLRGKHPSQPYVWEGTVPASLVAGHIVRDSVTGMPGQALSALHSTGAFSSIAELTLCLERKP